MKRLRITVEGKSYEVEVELLDESAPDPSSAAPAPVPVTAAKQSAPSSASSEGAILSPLSAVVVSVDVAVGDAVEAGRKVITLEAMKMNTTVSASSAGTVDAILVSVGDAVDEGQALIKLR